VFDLNLQDEVNAGNLLLLVQLEGIDDFENDDCVDVTILVAKVPEGEELVLEDERIAPGQAFEIDDASFAPPGEARVFGQGAIDNGRLRMGPLTFPLDIPMGGDDVLPLVLLDAQVTFSGADTAALVAGIIGGGLDVAASVDAINTLFGEDVVSVAVLRALADLAPDINNENCERLSIGLEFAAVWAQLHDPDD
jgi:hypothetical protein